MGVDYTPVLAVGLGFNDISEVMEFLKQNIELSEDDIFDIDEDGIEEWVYSKDFEFTVECLNYYTGDYYYVGVKLNPTSYSDLQKQIEDAFKSWNERFPNVSPNIVHTVKVY